MPGTNRQRLWRRHAWIAGALIFALLAGACSGGGGPGIPGAAPAGGGNGFSGTGSLYDVFAGSSAKGAQTVAGAQPDVNCPPVEVRQGASTLTIGSNGNQSAMAVRYQGEFSREARDCAVVSGNMVMRIGIQGRVILGPAGGPGQVEVPLRIAVVQETPGGARPITTKFIRIPVTVASNDSNPVFTHVEEGVTFPVPTPTSSLDDYIAYVGFDPFTAQAQDKPKEKLAPRARSRPKAAPSASAN
ncbi:MAG: hypothetical protein ACLPX7_19915 [Xanthobacteraceae bacterium]